MNPEILKAAAAYEAAHAVYIFAEMTAQVAIVAHKDADAELVKANTKMAVAMGPNNAVVINDRMYKTVAHTNCLNSTEKVKSIHVNNVTKEF